MFATNASREGTSVLLCFHLVSRHLDQLAHAFLIDRDERIRVDDLFLEILGQKMTVYDEKSSE